MRESRREDKEVGWLPLHNKQLILSISSRLGKGNTVAKAVQVGGLFEASQPPGCSVGFI